MVLLPMVRKRHIIADLVHVQFHLRPISIVMCAIRTVRVVVVVQVVAVTAALVA